MSVPAPMFVESTILTLRAQVDALNEDLLREKVRAGRLEADKDELLGQLRRSRRAPLDPMRTEQDWRELLGQLERALADERKTREQLVMARRALELAGRAP